MFHFERRSFGEENFYIGEINKDNLVLRKYER
jgi:hypothetical protein